MVVNEKLDMIRVVSPTSLPDGVFSPMHLATGVVRQSGTNGGCSSSGIPLGLISILLPKS